MAIQSSESLNSHQRSFLSSVEDSKDEDPKIIKLRTIRDHVMLIHKWDIHIMYSYSQGLITEEVTE